MREAGYQEKTVCGNLQLCAVIEAGLEGTTHAVGQRILDRARHRKRADEARRPDEDENEDEDEVAG